MPPRDEPEPGAAAAASPRADRVERIDRLAALGPARAPHPAPRALPPLLRIAEPAARALLLERAQPREHAAGAVLTEVGAPCDRLWFVLEGLLDIQRPDPSGEWLPGPILRPGDLYGSHALSGEATHSVRASALTDLSLLEVPSEALREGARRLPSLARLSGSVLARPALRRLLARLAARMPGEEERLLPFAELFVPVIVQAGVAVQEAGAPIEALRLLERGALSAAPRGGEASERAAAGSALRIGPGRLLAPAPYLLGLPSPFAVAAAEPSVILTAPAARLEPLLREAPALRRALGEVVSLDAEAPEGLPHAALEPDRSFEPEPEKGAGYDLDPGRPPSRPPWWRRVPFIRQREQMECGATCLRMIHRYYGYDLDRRSARGLARVSQYGTSLLDLAEAAERLGYLVTGVRVEGWEGLREVDLPAVAHVGGDHFVVVWRVDAARVQVSDPAERTMTRTREEFMSGFGGTLLLLRPTDRIARAAAEPEAAGAAPARPASDFSPRHLWPFVRPHRRVFLHLLLASVLLQVFGLALPLMTQVVIDRVLVRGDAGLLAPVLAGLLLVALGHGVVAFSRAYLVIHASIQVERSILQAVYRRVLSLAHSFFSRLTTGDLVRRFQEADEVKNFFVDNAVSAAVDLLMIATYGAVLLLIQPGLAVLYLGALLVNGGVVFLLTRPVRGQTTSFLQKFARADTHVIDSFKGIDPVKALALERPFGDWFDELLVPALDHARRAAQHSAAAAIAAGTLDIAATALLLFFGARLVLEGGLTLGQLMAVLLLARQLTAPFFRLLDQWRALQRTIVSLHRVGDLLEETPERDEHERRGVLIDVPRLRGEVRFEDVSFRYGGDPKDAAKNVLDALTLRIAPGEVVGVVGRSGCGKSTLARLLLRFHDPSGGRILLDGIDLRDLDPRSVREQVGLVTQDAFLYSASIRDNIACGRFTVDDEDVIRAARAAGAYDFVSELPYGFETLVGERGLQLSGGQKQRIVIARALCANPRILIFDEATAALDPIVEREIHEGLREVIRGRTTIIIAHRLHTLQHADRIAVLDRGRLVELGTHEELLARGGLYRSMYTVAPDWRAREAAGAAGSAGTEGGRGREGRP
jgi:ATP-binding cassette subfamily B protein